MNPIIALLISVFINCPVANWQETPAESPPPEAAAGVLSNQWQWQRIELPPGETATYNPAGERQVFAIQFDPQDRIYIANRYNGHGDEVVLRSADAGVTWQGVGPVDQWTLKVGPNDGGFRIHPLDPDRWFLGSENRGVFVTFDAGATWDQVIEAWTDHGIGHGFTFAFHPTDASVIYASGGVGVFRSTDGGRTWKNLGLPRSQTLWVAVDPEEPNRVYAAQMWNIGDVLRSENGGETWQAITEGIPAGRVTPTGYFHRSAWQLHVDVRDHRRIFVTTAAGLFVSNQLGNTWTRLGTPPQPGVMSGQVIFRQSHHDPGTLVTSESLGRIMLSRDSGQTWTELTGNLPTGAMPHRAFGIRVCELQFHPRDPDLLYVARSDGLYRLKLPRVADHAAPEQRPGLPPNRQRVPQTSP